MQELQIGRVYRHFKGDYYLVEGLAHDSESGVPCVIYRKLYGDGGLWVRPLEMFLSRVDREKYPEVRQEYRFQLQEIAKGRQVYVVYPLIEESESMDYKDLQDGYEAISRDFPLPEYVTEVVHGRMKSEDKEAAMRRFKSGEAQILVSTTVIEVGVDVPNATVMVIESAERFGLSQLHQLRGRVGRGAEQSYCILMSGEKLSKEARARLEAMCETNDGFRLAELDLKLRGAGDIAGTQQSGMAFDLKIANPTLDVQILQLTRDAAREVLDGDTALALPEHAGLRDLKRRYSGEKSIDFSMIS